MRDEALDRAIAAAGGTAKLAKALGLSSQAISQWRRCPINRTVEVERACEGVVTRAELRPDIFMSEGAAA
jgi:DNA-binding transcriptional regulator YdaS (Cro superfamily)